MKIVAELPQVDVIPCSLLWDTWILSKDAHMSRPFDLDINIYNKYSKSIF